MLTCPWARYWTPNCSQYAGWYPVWQPLPSVCEWLQVALDKSAKDPTCNHMNWPTCQVRQVTGIPFFFSSESKCNLSPVLWTWAGTWADLMKQWIMSNTEKCHFYIVFNVCMSNRNCQLTNSLQNLQMPHTLTSSMYKKKQNKKNKARANMRLRIVYCFLGIKSAWLHLLVTLKDRKE